MSRTNVRWRRAVVLAVLLAGGVTTTAGLAGAKTPSPAGDGLRAPAARSYVVASGDTLWRIAVRLVGPAEDPRPMVDRLSTLNGIWNGVIVPGQRLALP
jgi:LysM repeat protein